MLQISMSIWHWLLSSQEIIYTYQIKIIIKVTYYRILFHFISLSHPHTHTHTQHSVLQLTTAWPQMPWSLNRRSNKKNKKNSACLHWHDCECMWVWVCLHYGPTVPKMVAKPELICLSPQKQLINTNEYLNEHIKNVESFVWPLVLEVETKINTVSLAQHKNHRS